MADKDPSSSTLDALLERVPIMDGGSRRRLTAGTIVVLTIVAVSADLRANLTAAATTKDISLSLSIITGALLIYATGVLVELVGEVFLARAIGNAVWSYVAAANTVRTWRPIWKYLGWVPIVVLWGTIRGIAFFALGLFGHSRWRMGFGWRLSKEAAATYGTLPDAVRYAIEHALGNKGEFGRWALIYSVEESRS